MPPQLLALVVGSVVASLFLAGEVRVIGAIPDGLPEFQLPVFEMRHWQIMLANALVLAMLGSIDALLTSVIADSMTKRESDANKELIGQGIGNIASGLFGGIPGAGATMGTVVNIQSGGRSALSGLSRVAVLIVVLLWISDLTAMIPLAVLSGIAFKVGLDIIDWRFLSRAHIVSSKAALIMYGVILLTVFVDLIIAVAVGVFIANLLTIERLTAAHADSVKAIRDPNAEELSRDEQTILKETNGSILILPWEARYFSVSPKQFLGNAQSYPIIKR